MSVHLVLIIIAIVVILSFVVGIILKKKYQKGMISFDTTIIPSIGKKRTVIPPSQPNVVLSFEQPVSPVQAPSYVQPVSQPVNQTAISYVQPVSQPVSPVEVPSYVQSVSQPVSPVEVPSYAEQVNASFGSASSENSQKTGIIFDVPEEVLDFDQPVIIRSMDVD